MINDKRADPDELLASIEKEGQGKLTVFLGAAAGVGKTYAMLEAARERLAEGVDVVVGLVETHGRAETEAVLKGIPVIPIRMQEYKDKSFKEMDLEALLEHHPQLALVDELAHTNIPGSRHTKRYQDVEELLAAGINVYTTLNIQHLESLNDVVAQITGVTVRETVPDRVLEIASQIQMVDITPDELIQRLKEGKVYVPGQAAEAMKKFFRPGNINALREMSLRYTAKRVDSQMESYMRMHGIAGPWPSGEKVMVCVSSSRFSARLIRTAKRMATRQNAEWLAVHVTPPGRLPKSEAEKDTMAKNLRVAEKLGAEIISLHGDDIVEELLTVARKRNVSQIIIGKPERTRFQELLHGSIVDNVIRNSHGISIHVISGQMEAASQKFGKKANDSRTPIGHPNLPPRKKYSYTPYIMSVLMMTAMTLVVSPIQSFLGPINISMLYLLPVLLSAARWGKLPAIVTAGMGVVIFDFFFVPPFHTFTVDDFRYVISFVILMIVGFVTGTLSARLKNQIKYSRHREQQVSALYSLSRDLTAVDKLERVLDSIARKIADTLDGQVVLLLPDERDKLVLSQSSSSDHFMTESELAVATWVYVRGLKAGQGTETLGSAKALYLPLTTEQGTQGVLGICFNNQEESVNPEQIRFLDAFAGLAALAINRIKLADEARQAHTLAESERLRTALFNSLSHDLRTPLASIIGAATGLLEDHDAVYSREARHDLLQTILQGAERMNRFVNNLLDMARLESGMLKLNKDWCDIQDIIGVAINRLDIVLAKRLLDINIPAGVPLVYADYVLIEQVLVNLLDNAVKYSEPDSKIMISVRQVEMKLEIAVANRGTRIPETDLSKVFDKFYRLSSPLQVSGTGLGLSICKGIIETHDGDIWAENNELGGVTIIFNLPIDYEFSGKVPGEGGD
ncbi:sensor histidine kinase KdpD [Desulfosporosinus sp. OT]|uniref:sensor histidine kinase n=1 Tax=Desulfosporosinus sp. OT TaxID=913865 RepID=UPI0002239CD8|nr:sensor histidine kinase KdpD [Desulfosporosinus sp. OT]EGW39446.1 universal stress family protein [Desulfosporosinus sp. OT]